MEVRVRLTEKIEIILVRLYYLKKQQMELIKLFQKQNQSLFDPQLVHLVSSYHLPFEEYVNDKYNFSTFDEKNSLAEHLFCRYYKRLTGYDWLLFVDDPVLSERLRTIYFHLVSLLRYAEYWVWTQVPDLQPNPDFRKEFNRLLNAYVEAIEESIEKNVTFDAQICVTVQSTEFPLHPLVSINPDPQICLELAQLFVSIFKYQSRMFLESLFNSIAIEYV